MDLYYRLSGSQHTKFYQLYAKDYLFKHRPYQIKILSVPGVKRADIEQVKPMLLHELPREKFFEVKKPYFTRSSQLVHSKYDHIALSLKDEHELVEFARFLAKKISTQLGRSDELNPGEQWVPNIQLCDFDDLRELDKTDILIDLKNRIEKSRHKFSFEPQFSDCIVRRENL